VLTKKIKRGSGGGYVFDIDIHKKKFDVRLHHGALAELGTTRTKPQTL
jgi:hypothetical protein